MCCAIIGEVFFLPGPHSCMDGSSHSERRTASMRQGVNRMLIVAVLFALAACASPSARVPVMRPAEVNLSGMNKIAVGHFDGRGGQAIADILTAKLIQTNYFEVMNRGSLGRGIFHYIARLNQETAHLGWIYPGPGRHHPEGGGRSPGRGNDQGSARIVDSAPR